MIPPKPAGSTGRGSILRFARSFRRDLLSALPARFFHAWMAEYRSPLIHSFLCNDPALVRLILRDRPQDFRNPTACAKGLRRCWAIRSLSRMAPNGRISGASLIRPLRVAACARCFPRSGPPQMRPSHG